MKKNNHKKNYNIYYPKNFISLILLIAFIKEKKNNINRILYLNKNDIKNDIINFFRPFLIRYFTDIKIINYKRTQNYNRESQLKIAIERSQDVERLIKKININKIYSGGDDFNFAIYRIIGKIKPTIYLEHGFGMTRDSLSNVTNITFRKKIFYILTKIYYFFKKLNFYPIKYDGHLSILFSRINADFRFNNHLIDNLKISSKSTRSIINELIHFIFSKKKISIEKKSYVFLNSSYMKVPLKKEVKDQLFNQIGKVINKKRDIIIIKNSPNVINQKSKLNYYLFKFLKKKKIKFIFVKDKFLTNLPSELFIGLFKIKKLISDTSSTPFFSKIIFRKISCYVFYDYCKKNSNDRADKRLVEIESKIRKSFNDINFI